MAWPLDPLTTYVANTTPAIKADDLNSIQDAITKAFRGTYTFKALVVDGTGGAAATPTSGTIISSTAVARTLWIGAMQFFNTNDPWTWNGQGSSGSDYWESGASSDGLAAVVPLIYSAVASYTLTSVDFFVDKASTGACTARVVAVKDLTTAPTYDTADDASSSTSGLQIVTVGSLSRVATASKYVTLRYFQGNSGDKFYGARCNYTSVVF